MAFFIFAAAHIWFCVWIELVCSSKDSGDLFVCLRLELKICLEPQLVFIWVFTCWDNDGGVVSFLFGLGPEKWEYLVFTACAGVACGEFFR